MKIGLRVWVMAVFVAAITLIATPAWAVTISYNFDLTTPNGKPVTDLVIYSAAVGEDDVYLAPDILAPSGVQTLTHSLPFNPDSALILGINDGIGAEKPHVIMFADDSFAADAVGFKWSEVFDSSLPSYVRHSEVISLIEGAHGGDPIAMADLTGFLRGPQGAAAAFDPHGSYSVLQFSTVIPPIGGAIPEPLTATLGLMSLCALGIATRRRASHLPDSS